MGLVSQMEMDASRLAAGAEPGWGSGPVDRNLRALRMAKLLDRHHLGGKDQPRLRHLIAANSAASMRFRASVAQSGTVTPNHVCDHPSPERRPMSTAGGYSDAKRRCQWCMD